MKIKVLQNSIWRYDMMSKEKSLSARVWIVDKEWKVITVWQTDWKYPKPINAVLELWDNNDPEHMQEMIKGYFYSFNIPDLISLSEEATAGKWTTWWCYKADRELFIKTLRDNFDEIRESFLQDKNEDIEKQIQELKKNIWYAYTDSIEEF